LNRAGSLIVVITLIVLSVILSTHFSFGRIVSAIVGAVKESVGTTIAAIREWWETRKREKERADVIAKRAQKAEKEEPKVIKKRGKKDDDYDEEWDDDEEDLDKDDLDNAGAVAKPLPAIAGVTAKPAPLAAAKPPKLAAPAPLPLAGAEATAKSADRKK